MVTTRRQPYRFSNIWLNFVIVVALALLVFAGALTFLGFDITQKISDSADTDTRLEAVRIALVIVGGLGGAVALVVAYRRQRVAEENNRREEEANKREREKLLNERFATATAQLGHEAAAVRIAGVYALASLADDWTSQRRTCVDVLCAYLRMPVDRSAADPGEREVRLSIIRVIRDHLRPAAEEAVSWSGFDLDFTGATFDGGDFSGVAFTGASVSFASATFIGDVSFEQATVPAGEVSFDGARFVAGVVSFASSAFTGGHAHFRRSTLEGGQVSFERATIAGGALSLNVCRLSGGQLSFDELVLISGTLSLDDATFVGTEVSFNRADLRGGVLSLSLADLAVGTISFDGASLDGVTMVCDGVTTSGGVIDVSGVAHGPIPSALLELAQRGIVTLATGSAAQ